jgi:hypothetical protein
MRGRLGPMSERLGPMSERLCSMRERLGPMSERLCSMRERLGSTSHRPGSAAPAVFSGSKLKFCGRGWPMDKNVPGGRMTGL